MEKLFLDVAQNPAELTDFVTNTWRPEAFDKKTGKPVVNGILKANAMIGRDQWENIDQAVVKMARIRMNAWADVESRGLVSGTSLAEWLSSWNVSSEMTTAEVNMDFETQTGEDRTDRKRYSVPIPIISKTFSYGRREIITAERFGADLETNEAEEATAAVVDMLETILIDGYTSVKLEGNSIPGYRTLTARTTGSATGDFGTLSNIHPTFLAMIKAAGSNRYHGPFDFYLHTDQYTEMLEIYSDGTGDSALDRVLRIPKVNSVKINDKCTAGELIGVQLESNVVDIRQAMALEVRRWENRDGSRAWFKVMVAAAPRLKTDYNGKSGIIHYTGA